MSVVPPAIADRNAPTRSAGSTPFFRGLALFAVTAIAYLPVLRAGFVWDDLDNVVECQPLRTTAGLAAIWTDRHALPQYYPVTNTSYWVEFHLWGLRPLGYHVDNVLLHALCAVLLWRVLRALRVPGCWLAAAIFAVHPVHAESVAWVSERKNLVATLFYLLAMLVAVRWWWLTTDTAIDAIPDASNAATCLRRWGAYLLCLLFYVAAIFGKTIACSFPATLLVLVWWRRGRLARRDVLPTIPFFLVGLLLALNTAALERAHFNTVGPQWTFSPVQRLLIAGQVIRFAVEKVFWPHPLMPIYPRVIPDASSPAQFVAPVATLAVLAALWLLRRRTGRGPLAAVLVFLLTLFPTLGVTNINYWRFSFVTDHFVYPASVGLIVLAVAALRRVTPPGAFRRAIAATVLLLLSTLTFDRALAYRSAQVLWADNVRKNPASPGPHVNYALAFEEQGRHADAEAEYRAALAADPDDSAANTNLAGLLLKSNRPREAIPLYRRAVAVSDDPEMRLDLGVAYERAGDAASAEREYAASARLRPDWADPYAHAARLAAARNDLRRAEMLYRRAAELAPADVDVRLNLGTLMARQGHLPAAIACFRDAVALRPNSVPARHNLITALIAAGDAGAATAEIDALLALDPTDAQAYNSRGLIAAARHDYPAAEAAFAKAVELDPTFAAAQNNLAAAKAARQRATTKAAAP